MMSGPQPFGAPQQPQGSGSGELPQSTTLIAPPLSPPKTGTSTRSIPQTSDISNDDVRFQLEFDIELEVSDALETFVYLSRIGRYKEADALFHEFLISHLDSFIVVAEYVDSLIGQRRFGHLTEFLTESLRSGSAQPIKDRLLIWEFQRDEIVLLRLILKFSEIHSHGELRSALEYARTAIASLQYMNTKDPTEVEVSEPGGCNLRIAFLTFSDPNCDGISSHCASRSTEFELGARHRHAPSMAGQWIRDLGHPVSEIRILLGGD